jgi:hypothetical protein
MGFELTDVNQILAIRFGENKVQHSRNVKLAHFVPSMRQDI